MSIILDGTTGITTPDLIDSSLTSGRVVYAGASGNLTGASGFTFDGTNLSIGGTPVSSGGYTALTLNNATNSGYVVLQKNASTVSDWYVSGGIEATFRGVGVPLTLMSTGANYIRAEVNGSERMRITSAGDVGIGTSSPAQKLDVSGSGVISARITSTSSSATLILNSASGFYNYLQYTSAGSGGLILYDTTNSANRVVLDSAGNLGLGVIPSAWDSSARALQISNFSSVGQQSTGSFIAGFNFYQSATGFRYLSTNPVALYSARADGSHAFFTAASGTAGNPITFTQAMTLNADGTLGIGSTGAGNKLTVSNAGANGFEVDPLSASGTKTKLISINRSGSAYTPFQYDASLHEFQISGGEKARIDSSGNLLVGTTTATNSPFSSTSKFVVSGDFTGGFGQSITDTSTNTAVDHYMISFNLGTASGNQKGYIQFVGASGLILYATTSDQRLKTDLGVVTNTSVIDNLLIHDYTWKESGIAGRGVFAQEAYEVMPNAVGKGKDSPDGSINRPWGVDYSKFIPDLIVHAQQLKKQVQEQQAIIESLKARLDAANL